MCQKKRHFNKARSKQRQYVQRQEKKYVTVCPRNGLNVDSALLYQYGKQCWEVMLEMQVGTN